MSPVEIKKQTPEEWLRTHQITSCQPSWEFDVRATNTIAPRHPGRRKQRNRAKVRRRVRKSLRRILTEGHVLSPQQKVELYRREMMFEQLHRPTPRPLPPPRFCRDAVDLWKSEGSNSASVDTTSVSVPLRGGTKRENKLIQKPKFKIDEVETTKYLNSVGRGDKPREELIQN